MSKVTLEDRVDAMKESMMILSKVYDTLIIEKYDSLVSLYQESTYLSNVINVFEKFTWRNKQDLIDLMDFYINYSDSQNDSLNDICKIMCHAEFSQVSNRRDEYFPDITSVFLNYKNSENLSEIVAIYNGRDFSEISDDLFKILNHLLLEAKNLPKDELYDEKIFLNLIGAYSGSYQDESTVNYFSLIDNFIGEKDFTKLIILFSTYFLENLDEYTFDHDKKRIDILSSFVNKYFESNERIVPDKLSAFMETIYEELEQKDFIKSIGTINNAFDVYAKICNIRDVESGFKWTLHRNFYEQLNQLVNDEYSNQEELNHYTVEIKVNNWMKSISNNLFYSIYLEPKFDGFLSECSLDEREKNKLEEAYMISKRTVCGYESEMWDDNSTLTILTKRLDYNFINTLKEGLESFDTIEEKRSVVYEWSSNIIRMIKEKPELLFEYLSFGVGGR